MEQTPFELTAKQKSILATLSRETGKPVAALLDAALAVLQEHKHLPLPPEAMSDIPPPAPPPLSVLDIFREAHAGIPEEAWQALPEDLAAQHDHYIYRTPKRVL
jgi:hypothetical protein